MRVSLVYPPNRNIPSSPYGALPLLAGCLGAAGHEARIFDANLEVFERMLTRSEIAKARQQFEETWATLRSKTELKPDEARWLQGLARLSVVPFEELERSGERAGEILRKRELFDEPANVNWAYDVIANVVRAMYCLNPIYFLMKPGAKDEFFSYLAGDGPTNNPIGKLTNEIVLEQVLESKPDMVGVCIPFTEQLVEGISFVKLLKQRAPHVKVVVGGAIISSFEEVLCTDPRLYDYVDFAMPGEADDAFPELCTTVEQGGDLKTVPNLWHQTESGEIHAPPRKSLPNLNEIAAPDFSTVPVGRYFLPDTIANYQTSRGCYYGKCTFCSFDIKQNFRYRKIDLVAQDIEKIQEQTGLRHFIFWDPLTPPKLMKSIAAWNKDRGDQKIFWGAETKFERIFTDAKAMELFYDGGARFMQFGYESGSQRVLDLMVKGNDVSRVDKMLSTMRDANIAVSVQWFIGFPGETEEEARQSYRFLDQHRDSVVLSSYMGTYTISPNDDVFESKGDLYDIDIFQREDGLYDFRYRNGGGDHYDREELSTAYQARGDSENITRMAFYLYLTKQPERVRELTNFQKAGSLPESWDDLAGTAPVLPSNNYLRTWDFDIFSSPEDQGIAPEGSPMPSTPSHGVFVTTTQMLYPLNDVEHEMVRRANGKNSPDQILDGLEGDREMLQRTLLSFIVKGILAVPLRKPVAV